MKFNSWRTFSFLIGIFSALLATWAQAPGTGAIRGTILNQNGKPVPGASIEVENQGTQGKRLAASDVSGVYSVPLLTPGNYNVRAAAPGMKDAEAKSVSVVVSETSTVDLYLAVAGDTTNIKVTAKQDLVDTESSTLGRVVDEKSVQSLPLSNRNYTQILSLSPGVLVGLPDATVLGRGTQDVESNGGKTTANNIQFNGIDANNLAQNSAAADGEEVGVAVPAPDTIQEFKVQTGNYDAAYGRGTGANVDFVSKSGTNHLHGSAWDFLRNEAFNANDFFSKQTGQPRAVLKQNQYGAAVGGPILRDRTFFFAAFQGLRSTNGEGDESVAILPQLTNDRSAATLGAQYCAYPTFAGGAQIACDGSNISPVALKVLNFKLKNGQYAVPNPQISLPSSDPTTIPIGESTYTTPLTYQENQYTLNLDHAIVAKNLFGARLFYSRAPSILPFSPNAATVPGWGTNEVDKNAMAVLSDTHIFESKMVNIARFGFMRFDGVSAIENPISTADLGTQSPTGSLGATIAAQESPSTASSLLVMPEHHPKIK